MKRNLFNLALGQALLFGMAACQSSNNELLIEHKNDSLSLIHISKPSNFLLLPIQESANEGKVKLETGSPADVSMDIRMAVDSIDYYVPFELPKGSNQATVTISQVNAQAICWDSLRISDHFNTQNTDYYRPVYHHTPLYGWMNDANGLVYKDGEYHLYFQYNPYGSKWGNMHWGHSVSKDLIHWEHLKPAIARDTLGHIFSGSSIIDHNNSAGYGKDAMIAFYTSASDEHGQIQCMAYSNDNGRTFTKYEKNPILTPFDGLKDFRDPKVFWYEPAQKWYMIVSADKEMRFYSSTNLKEWEFLSGFGKGYGVQPNQFECPDFIQLPVDGDPNHKKWVMIVNINPGCMFGGSATEYFIGDFDGKEFTCDSKPETAKWLDFGKDHYATVCFSNTADRVIAVPWMSNWQYANATPIQQYRGANALPRELSLYSKDGEIYMAANVIKEAEILRKDSMCVNNFTLAKQSKSITLNSTSEGACEIELDITPNQANTVGFRLLNDKNEYVNIYLDMKAGRLITDRNQSGIINLEKYGEMVVHDKETDEHRKTLSVNYQNDFALGTWAPLALCKGKTYHLNIFIDKCSIEVFADEGRIAMTNLVFPTKPYNTIEFYSKGGEAIIGNVKLYKLDL